MLATSAQAGPGQASPSLTAPPWAVGRGLSLGATQPVMQSAYVPAAVDLLAARPGAGDGEAWGVGRTNSPARPGEIVFLHQRGGDWTVSGPAVDPAGHPLNAPVISLSIARNGEGWAVISSLAGAYSYALLHHDPRGGNTWRLDADASRELTQDVAAATQGPPQQEVTGFSVSVDSPSAAEGSGGAFGYLLLSGDRAGWMMRLEDGAWALDKQATGGSGQLSGLVSAVAATGPDAAWAGGSAYTVALQDCLNETHHQLQQNGTVPVPQDPAECRRKAQAVLSGNAGSSLYHRTAAGWQAVPPAQLPAVAQCGVTTALAADAGGGVWVTGAAPQSSGPQTSQVSAPSPYQQPACQLSQTPTASAPTTLSFVMNVPLGGGAPAPGQARWWCDGTISGGCPGASGQLPIGYEVPSAIATAPSRSGRGAVFVATGGAYELLPWAQGGSYSSVAAGLYRLQPDGGSSDFAAEPITVGSIGSMAFSGADEGWVESPYAGDLLGHWTLGPEQPRTARWPTPVGASLAAVAADPAGSGTLMAVGGDQGRGGGIWREDPRTGLWSQMLATREPLRAISWPRADQAWAVGGRSLYGFDGRAWHTVDVAGGVASNLEAVAALPAALPPGAPPPVPPAVAPASARCPAPPPLPPGTHDGGGELVSWGGNSWGELGTGSTSRTGWPAIAGCFPGGVIAVSAGGDDLGGGAFSMAISCPCETTPYGEAGEHLWTWGNSPSGALGLEDSQRNPVQEVDVPTEVAFPGAPRWFLAASAGYDHAMALTWDPGNRDSAGGSQTTVWAWGADDQNQLGDGAHGQSPTNPTLNAPSVPRYTPGPVANPPGINFTALAAGNGFSLALAGNGSVWTWGAMPSSGAGSAGTPFSSPVPTQISGLVGAQSISAGFDHALALACPSGVAGLQAQAGGTCAKQQLVVWGWGLDDAGQVGTGCASPCQPAPVDAGDLTGASSVVAGHEMSFAVVGGQVWRWGAGVEPKGTGEREADAPIRLAGLTGVDGLTAGGSQTANPASVFVLARRPDGSVLGWGDNSSGQLAVDTQRYTVVPSPTALAGLSALAPLSAGKNQTLMIAPRGFRPPPRSAPPRPSGAGPAPSASPVQGWAVGDGGTTLRFDGQRWTAVPGPTQMRLMAVAATSRDFVAVGDDGVILVDNGSGWLAAPTPPELASGDYTCRSDWTPLFAVSALPDGTVLAGGGALSGLGGALVERDPGDAELHFHLSSLAPLQGVVHALSARRDRTGRLRALASVALANAQKDVNQSRCDVTPQDLRGLLLAGDRDGWTDAAHDQVAIYNPEGGDGDPDATMNMAPVSRDNVNGVLLDPSGWSGWAVGDRGSLWRASLNLDDPGAPDYRPGGPERSPMEAVAAIRPDAGAVAGFAYLSDTGCSQGRCAHQLGWGTRGDVITIEAMRAIQSAARDGTVAFVAGGGDLRRRGDAVGGVVSSNQHDLEQLRGLMQSLGIPVYEALGSRDLDPTGPGGTLDGGIWQSVFGGAGVPAPWGGGSLPAGVRPVLHGGAATGQAATHYAFDYTGRDGATLRVVVLDTSSGQLGVSGQNPNESQLQWLQGVLGPRTPPAVVIMNEPVVGVGTLSDPTVTAALTGDGSPVAVLATAVPPNHRIQLTGKVSAYMLGSGGGPFFADAQSGGAQVDPVPDGARGQDSGYYFAWQLVSLDGGPAGPSLHVRSIPVLDSIALQAPAGNATRQGLPIRFTAAGRVPEVGRYDAGGGSSVHQLDPSPTSLDLPFPRACGGAVPAAVDAPGAGPGCRSAGVVPPDYRFSSSDTAVLLPVIEDPAHPGHPLHDGDHAVPDPGGQSGLFCAYRPGTVTVRVEAGTVAAQLPVTVTAAGGGECGPLPPPPPPTAAAARPALPVQNPPPAPAGPAHAARLGRLQVPVGAVIPPPAEVVPAPPSGSGAEKREEEHEVATEDANMTALPPSTVDRDIQPLLAYGGFALGTALLAILAGLARRRARPSRAAAASLGRLPSPPPRRDRWRPGS